VYIWSTVCVCTGGSRSGTSLRELCEGNLEGGSFSGDPGGCVKEGSGDGHLSP
jgi:hypothetical protein